VKNQKAKSKKFKENFKKSEILNPKSETNPNSKNQKPKIKNQKQK
jgi:hypothetical protein